MAQMSFIEGNRGNGRNGRRVGSLMEKFTVLMSRALHFSPGPMGPDFFTPLGPVLGFSLF